MRIFISELLLRLALFVAPKNKDGIRLVRYIGAYINDVMLKED